jgi:hypothetical protein
METTFALLLAVSASGSVGSKECRLSSFAQVWRRRCLTLALPGEQAWNVQNRWVAYGSDVAGFVAGGASLSRGMP